VKFRRLALLAVLILTGTVIAAPWSRGATTQSPAGLPLYQFVDNGTGALPWNAVALTSQLSSDTMLGGPHTVSNSAEGVVAFRTQANHLAYFTQSATGTTSFTDLSATQNYLPAPSSDPIPFFDPAGNVDLLYIDDTGEVVVLSANDALAPFEWHYQRQTWHPYIITNIGHYNRQLASNGLPSINVTNNSAVVSYRTSTDQIMVSTLNWSAPSVVPSIASRAVDVIAATNPVPTTTTTTTTTTLTTTSSSSTTTTTAPKTSTSSTTTTAPKSSTTTTTTTTKPTTSTSSTTTTTTPKTTTSTTTSSTTTTTLAPKSYPAVASDPIVMPGGSLSVAAINNIGDVIIYSFIGSNWTRLDVTALTGGAKVSGQLSVSSNGVSIYLAALTPSGTVELFSSPYVGYSNSLTTAHTVVSTSVSWTAMNSSTFAPTAPPLDGSIYLAASSSGVTVAGQAANWGDLFSLSGPIGTGTWTSTDVSATGGSAARTVGQIVAGTMVGSSLTLYAAGVDSPPLQGVGLYAIPSADWGKAITSGWPILSETGGLGTQSSPWVGFTSTTSVAQSPDFLLGQTIYNSHQRVTWLSFWTVSGPIGSEARNVTTYYNHGFAGGAWVATQIDQYRGLGVGLKPDWVIFDPEGYPDNHSGLDAPGGSSAGTISAYSTYWQAMLKGWAAGLASVDPTLNAGVYAAQSEYRNYGLANQSLPVFMAVAFGNGGPVPVTGATGSNIRGYIAFNASCQSSSLSSEISTLKNPPWSGQFNTLQFNAGVYCSKPTS